MATDASWADQPVAYQLISGLAAQDALGPVMQVMQHGFDPLYGEAWNHSQTRSMLAMPLSHTILAETLPDTNSAQTRFPIAFAMTRRVADEEELLLIAVLPDWRRHRIGTALLEQVIENARNAGVSKIFLEMRSNNPASHLYQNFGFGQVGLRRNYYIGADSRRHDALTLQKPL